MADPLDEYRLLLRRVAEEAAALGLTVGQSTLTTANGEERLVLLFEVSPDTLKTAAEKKEADDFNSIVNENFNKKLLEVDPSLIEDLFKD